MVLTTWEASEKYGLSASHLRLLVRSKKIKGRQANTSSRHFVWLLEEDSLKKYVKKERKPGPKSKK